MPTDLAGLSTCSIRMAEALPQRPTGIECQARTDTARERKAAEGNQKRAAAEVRAAGKGWPRVLRRGIMGRTVWHRQWLEFC